MQVVAIRQGFYGGARRRVGDIFDMNVAKDKLPRWVEVVTDPTKAKTKAAEAKAAEEAKQKAGAIAASGGKAAKAKTDAMAAELVG